MKFPAFLLAISLFLQGCTTLIEATHFGGTEQSTIMDGTAYRIKFDPGGYQSKAIWWNRLKDEEDLAHLIIDGQCISMCAFIAFQHPLSCYTKNAVVSFHSYSFLEFIITGDTVAATMDAIDRQPTPLRNFLKDIKLQYRPSVLGIDLTYADLKRLIPEQECSELEKLSKHERTERVIEFKAELQKRGKI